MSRKTFIIILLILGLIFGGIFAYVYFTGKTKTSNPPVSNNPGFNPFTNNNGSSTPTRPPRQSTSTPITTTNTPPKKVPSLRQISATPTAGAWASSTATTTLIRYMDRGVGHIYQTQSNTTDSIILSFTTVPKVHNAVWSKEKNIIMQYEGSGNGEISNFYAQLLPEKISTSSLTSTSTETLSTKPPYSIKGYSLSNKIIDFSISPTGDRLFTLTTDSSGETVGYISLIDGSKRTEVWRNPLNEWITEWPQENLITLTTKATAFGPGYMYTFDTKTKAFERKIGGIRGLTTLTNKKGTKVFFSAIINGELSTKIGNLKDGSSQDAVIRTLPEKCVWSKLNPDDVYCAVPNNIDPKKDYPDEWYQGTLSFNDQIWHLNTATGEIHLLANLLKISGKIIDVSKPFMDNSEHYLFFTNKKDLSLWSLDLTSDN